MDYQAGLGKSDHVMIKVMVRVESLMKNVEGIPKRNFRKMDLQGAQKILKEVDWEKEFELKKYQ